jgi:Xaa-Pro aminopeptidase
VGADRRRERLQQAVGSLRDQGLDALLVSHLPNARYLTGFTGSSGILLVGHAEMVLFADSRYEVQAEEEAGEVCRVEIVAGDLWDAVRRAVENTPALHAVGFEAHDVTARAASQLGEGYRPAGEVIEGLRAAKDPQEVAAITAAAQVVSAALEAVLPEIRPGLREIDVAASLERALRVRGSEWHPFPTIAASGPRSALPHARTTERTLETGDWLLLDFGARVEGYCADVTRTMVVGRRADERQREVYEVVRAAQTQAISQIRAGMTGREADECARSVIGSRGFGDAFGHALGHGVGLEVHEAPRLSRTNDDPLPAGCVVTVEPGVYLPGWGGVRIEDDVRVTDQDAELLTDGRTELLELV